jgi:hypothetical protein
MPGSYTLELRADDGEFSVTDIVEIAVALPPPNAPPQVDAGPDIAGLVGAALALSGSVSDDGLSGPLAVSWAVVTQPGGSTVSFGNAAAAATTASFDQPGSYTLELRANDGELWAADTLGVQISAAPQRALLVSASTPVPPADAAVIGEMQALGFEVSVVDDDQASASQAAGQALVVISSTTASDKVGDKFAASAVPVVVWEPYVFDDMGLTGSVLGSDYGFALGQSALVIEDHTHALAAGLSGAVEVSSTGQKMAWGVPGSAAQRVATLPGSSARAVIFGYESGAALLTGVAPARRVGLFLGDESALSWTPQAQALLRAALQWATAP